MGKAEKTIIDQCVIQRMPLPSVIQDCPEFIPGMDVFYDAFVNLSTCRNSGLSVSPIPWTAINTYADVNLFEGEDKDELFYFVGALDAFYLDHFDKKSKEKKK